MIQVLRRGKVAYSKSGKEVVIPENG